MEQEYIVFNIRRRKKKRSFTSICSFTVRVDFNLMLLVSFKTLLSHYILSMCFSGSVTWPFMSLLCLSERVHWVKRLKAWSVFSSLPALEVSGWAQTSPRSPAAADGAWLSLLLCFLWYYSSTPGSPDCRLRVWSNLNKRGGLCRGKWCTLRQRGNNTKKRKRI